MKTIRKTATKGFTLIELLVVVAIIAILALIVLLALNPVEMARRSRDSRRMSDVGTLRKSLDLALADGEALPDTSGVFVPIDTSDSVITFKGTTDISKYLSVVPGDPYTGGSTTQVITGTGDPCPTGPGTPAYTFWSDGDTYVIRAIMESQENCAAVTNDGSPNGTYEIGTYPGLNP